MRRPGYGMARVPGLFTKFSTCKNLLAQSVAQKLVFGKMATRTNAIIRAMSVAAISPLDSFAGRIMNQRIEPSSDVPTPATETVGASTWLILGLANVRSRRLSPKSVCVPGRPDIEVKVKPDPGLRKAAAARDVQLPGWKETHADASSTAPYTNDTFPPARPVSCRPTPGNRPLLRITPCMCQSAAIARRGHRTPQAVTLSRDPEAYHAPIKPQLRNLVVTCPVRNHSTLRVTCMTRFSRGRMPHPSSQRRDQTQGGRMAGFSQGVSRR